MSDKERLDDALDAALDALRKDAQAGGVPTPGDSGEELNSLVDTGAAIQSDAAHTVVPQPERLDENFTIVRAALQRAAMAAPLAAGVRGRASEPWWRRRFAIASMSMPLAGMFAVLAFGAAGAAAATVGVTAAVRGDNPLAAISHIPGHIADVVKPDPPATPGASVAATNTATGPSAPSSGAPATDPTSGGSSAGVPGSVRTASTPQSDGAAPSPPTAAPSPAAASPSPADAGASPADATPPPADAPPASGPVATTVSGTITEVHGNTFTLSTDTGEFKVQIDANTDTTGVIAVGASATVSGELTGGTNIHADSVVVASTAAQSAMTPTPAETSPPGQVSTHTPGPPPDKGPQTTHTPPGQGGGTGSGNGNTH